MKTSNLKSNIFFKNIAFILQQTFLREFWKQIKKYYHKGNEFYCPVCESDLKNFIKNCYCPICGLVERHRFFWFYFEQSVQKSKKNNLIEFLHIAPELELMLKLKKKYINYKSIDLSSHRSSEKGDITDLKYIDETFDMIYCSHVLEHIEQDHLALKELYRILKKDGVVFIQIPLLSQYKTIEDPLIKDPKERKKIYGQEDHVRFYGLDIKDKIESYGFIVEVIKSSDSLLPEEQKKYCIHNEFIFLAKKSNV